MASDGITWSGNGDIETTSNEYNTRYIEELRMFGI